MASTPPAGREHVVWRRAYVDGRPTIYASIGEGPVVLFLHGWGLAHTSYRRALHRLADAGFRAVAPAMPGFGGTPDLHGTQLSFGGYAAWVTRLLDALEVDEPAVVIGHSFGGGVAIKLAHDHPERVRALVLVNSVGGSAWTAGRRVRSLAERPLWDWGLHFPADVLPLRQATRVLPVIVEDAVSNLVRNPLGLWKVANLARQADLRPELEELRRRRTPVVVLWGDQDRIIPKASFEALCAAIGADGSVVSGTHSWILADPDALGEVMTNVLAVAEMAQGLEAEEAAERDQAEPAGIRRIVNAVRRRSA